jgi:hypothetical protein
MDHHCIWINNCIGFENKKYFVLLVAYGLILSLCAAVCMFPVVMAEYRGMRESGVWSWYTAGLVVEFGVICILLGTLIVLLRYQMLLVMINKTAIEEERDGNIHESQYDEGRKTNWRQVFGKGKLWWLPTTPNLDNANNHLNTLHNTPRNETPQNQMADFAIASGQPLSGEGNS